MAPSLVTLRFRSEVVGGGQVAGDGDVQDTSRRPFLTLSTKPYRHAATLHIARGADAGLSRDPDFKLLAANSMVDCSVNWF